MRGRTPGSVASRAGSFLIHLLIMTSLLSTAMATGFKTDRGVLGMLPDGQVGQSLFEGEYDDAYAIVRWAHKYRSTQLVLVFAFGPGPDAFSGVFDNTAFSSRIAVLLNLENFPVLADSLQN